MATVRILPPADAARKRAPRKATVTERVAPNTRSSATASPKHRERRSLACVVCGVVHPTVRSRDPQALAKHAAAWIRREPTICNSCAIRLRSRTL